MTTEQEPLTLEKIRELRDIKPHPLTPDHFVVQPPLPIIAIGDRDCVVCHIDMFQISGPYPNHVHFSSGYWYDPKNFRYAPEHES